MTNQPLPASATQSINNQIPAPQPTVQQPIMQTAYVGSNGGIISSNEASVFNSPNGVPNTSHNHLAIAAFVCGVIGCVGWIIPLAGTILGLLALIFGTIALRSQKRVFAITGIVLAIPVLALSIFFWVKAAQKLIKTRSQDNSSQVSAPATNNTGSTITSPCYTFNTPSPLTITQTAGSCTFNGTDTTNGHIYEVKVLNVPQLTTARLPQLSLTDAKNVVNAVPGGSISGQQSTTFASSPAYTINIVASDGSAGSVSYVYHQTPQGNLIIIFHAEQNGKDTNLSAIENNWSWK
ncbi:MAG: hypothetical protein NVSMB46_07160 [Candidatus Saccharimonadales bacterium]